MEHTSAMGFYPYWILIIAIYYLPTFPYSKLTRVINYHFFSSFLFFSLHPLNNCICSFTVPVGEREKFNPLSVPFSWQQGYSRLLRCIDNFCFCAPFYHRNTFLAHGKTSIGFALCHNFPVLCQETKTETISALKNLELHFYHLPLPLYVVKQLISTNK